MKTKKEGISPSDPIISFQPQTGLAWVLLSSVYLYTGKKLSFSDATASEKCTFGLFTREFLATFAAVNGTLCIFLPAIFANQFGSCCSKLSVNCVQLLVKFVNCSDTFGN